MQNAPFAEVIESSLTKIVAQCWHTDIVPTFGQCIGTHGNSIIIYALVHHIQTGSMDSIRKPSPFKKTIAELKREQPHIFEFLITSFECIPIAYTDKNRIVHALPPEPPRIHEFVHHLTPAEMMNLFDKKQFLINVFGMQQQIDNIDELLLACLHLVHKQKQFPLSYYVDLLDIYALLVNNEYKRVKLFARRLEEIF